MIKKAVFYFGYTLLIGFFLFSIGFSFYSFSKPLKVIIENKKFEWKKEEANIMSVVLESRLNPNAPKEAPTVFPIEECKIEYSFNYDNKQYTNTSIGLNEEKIYYNTFHNDLYTKLADRKKVIVYVNPENPNQSSLIKYDFNLKDIADGIATISFPLLFIYWFYLGKKYRSGYLAKKINIIT